jgi:hypothetical protein
MLWTAGFASFIPVERGHAEAQPERGASPRWWPEVDMSGYTTPKAMAAVAACPKCAAKGALLITCDAQIDSISLGPACRHQRRFRAQSVDRSSANTHGAFAYRSTPTLSAVSLLALPKPLWYLPHTVASRISRSRRARRSRENLIYMPVSGAHSASLKGLAAAVTERSRQWRAT